MVIIKKRTGDWWFFTLIPILVFLLISFLLYLAKTPLILLATQQLFFYALILSSTEIGIQFRINSHIDENKFKGSWPGITILIISAILLPTTYIAQTLFQACPYIFLIISISCSLIAIWISNQNEYSGIPNFPAQREKQQEKFSEKVENPEQTYKEVKI
ncbi:MAG: hypothetical protein WC438_01810 [Candidatus Pacearchaeota archaeon]